MIIEVLFDIVVYFRGFKRPSLFHYIRFVDHRDMAVPAESIMDSNLNDPVTKAVVDNIMGNLPTKKPLVRCDDCDLSFTSQAVLDTHLQGARHAKQVCKSFLYCFLRRFNYSHLFPLFVTNESEHVYHR